LGITAGYTQAVTKKTAISLPDELFRAIERARKRSRLDRSTWLQQAAFEYLKKATADEVEQWYTGYERVPMTEDELSFVDWGTKHFGEMVDALEAGATRRTNRRIVRKGAAGKAH